MKNTEKILAVPTNIITGFLGVGKTSAIQHLLKQKPDHERWAILVNEFGEIGVDKGLFTTNHAQKNNVFIEEVPGGCMCCASGVPMQIALNKLLTKARPHRLLIEPTGLGHPLEVLQLLSSQHYRDVLSIQKTLTLVDARNLSDKRYTEHPTFNQQINIADIIVGNKADLYQKQDKKNLLRYITESPVLKSGEIKPQLYFSEHSKISLAWLTGSITPTLNLEQVECTESHDHIHKHHKPSLMQKTMSKTDKIMSVNERPFPASGIIRADNHGEGYQSIGWRFSSDNVFNKHKLLNLLNSLSVARIKAVFITDDGVFSYNKAYEKSASIGLIEGNTNNESRIEIIHDEATDNMNIEWQRMLIEAIQNTGK